MHVLWKMDLVKILYTVIMEILAFLAVVVVTKTLSKYLKLDEKDKEEDDTTLPE